MHIQFLRRRLSRMRSRQPRTHIPHTLLLAILPASTPALIAQTQPAPSHPDRSRLLNVQPNVSGLFGLQIEGTPYKVSFRNLWLKKID